MRRSVIVKQPLEGTESILPPECVAYLQILKGDQKGKRGVGALDGGGGQNKVD